MGRYVDVVSVNVMGPARTFYGELEQVTRHWDGPILLADTGAGHLRRGVGEVGLPDARPR